MIVVAIIAALPFAIVLGIARGRVFTMGALERVVSELGAWSSLAQLQRMMSRAFADPKLQLLFRDHAAGRLVDIDGREIETPAGDPRRKVTEFTHGDTLAAIVHDPLVARDALAAAASAVRLALDNAGLQRELSASIDELAASRQRVAWTADEERRRIEQGPA